MAFFKFRLPNPGLGDDGSSGGTSGESLEALRRRARQRLIGATVLVLLAVVGFPILFDTQPRPVSVDIPIDIPDKQKTSSQTAPAALKSAADQRAHATDTVSTQASLERNEEVVAPSSAAGAVKSPVAESSVAKVDAAAKPVVADKAATDKPAADKAADKMADKPAADKAAADKPADTAAPRFVVQVGAYADDAKAREVRGRLEKAGLKTYTHVAETKDGKRTRVRLGPFATKDEADKAAARAKTMNLQATVLTL
jgi:DedD protein